MSTNFTASQLHGGRRWCFPFTPVNGTTGANPEPDVPFGEKDHAMVRMIPAAAAALLAALILTSELPAQVRVTPKEAKGGQPQGEPWADVPEGFRNLKIPAWPANGPQTLAGHRPAPHPRRAAEAPGRDAAAARPGEGQGAVEGGPGRLRPGAVRVPQRRGHGRAGPPLDPQEPEGPGPGGRRPARPRQLQG